MTIDLNSFNKIANNGNINIFEYHTSDIESEVSRTGYFTEAAVYEDIDVGDIIIVNFNFNERRVYEVKNTLYKDVLKVKNIGVDYD